MKKGLIIIVAALFVAAMALPAAAVDVSISGYYQVRGIYQSNASHGMVTPWDGVTVPTLTGLPDLDGDSVADTLTSYGSPDAWWDHFLCLEPVFTITDNLKLHTAIGIFNNQMWGSSKTSGACCKAGEVGVDAFGDDATNISWDAAYIEWATPKGTLMVGRMAGNYIYFTDWANTEMCLDRIEYTSPLWNGFGLNAFMEKRQENSATSGNNAADEDIDRYSLVFSYGQPCYSIGAGINYVRDRSESAALPAGSTEPGIWKADQYDYIFGLTANDPTNTWFFQGELMINNGDYRDYYGATQDIDRGGWGYYVNLGMKKEALTVGVATAFTSGDDNDSDSDYDVGPASGLDFQPLYILYGPYCNILNTSLMDTTRKAGYSNSSQFDNPTGSTATGSQAYWLYADYQVNPQLAVRGALGVAYADKISNSLYQDDEFGAELDLGLKYQLMSNLAYELHFGYLWTGDFFKGAAANNYNTDDIYQIDHSLTLSF
ncbi:MAG: hypothetical protein Q8O04_00880 [Deltaproteobacteria bacterium]|nr:hypothetical protein [Deltaproteobacteria bacterium]